MLKVFYKFTLKHYFFLPLVFTWCICKHIVIVYLLTVYAPIKGVVSQLSVRFTILQMADGWKQILQIFNKVIFGHPFQNIRFYSAQVLKCGTLEDRLHHILNFKMNLNFRTHFLISRRMISTLKNANSQSPKLSQSYSKEYQNCNAYN